MGAYLNSQTPYTLYQSESRSPYFVDKTMLLQELFPYVAAGNRHLCVTRPRRFGKTIAANMISSFFQKGIDSGELFDRLKISEADDCQKYKNKYNVIRIDFSKMPRNCESYRQYIERVEELLISDLRENGKKTLTLVFGRREKLLLRSLVPGARIFERQSPHETFG